MKIRILISLLLFSSFSTKLIAQLGEKPSVYLTDLDAVHSSQKLSKTRAYSRARKFYVHWGYNISGYKKSDITFNGPGYNFTLNNVVAHDRPTKRFSEYVNPGRITVPQFNFRMGYFINDRYSISVGWDHMKYVMDVPQQLKITGHIDPQISNPTIATGKYAGDYNNSDFTVNRDFLSFEHTDGFNYASVDVERNDDIWVSKSGKMNLTAESGVGSGVIVPRTDVRLLGVGENNYWNLAGWGISAKAGLKFYAGKHLYAQSNLKTGYTNLSHIHTTGRNKIDKASQSIVFLENYWVLGFQF